MSKKKTTLYIPPKLLKQAKMQALAEGTTVTELVERGLRKVVKTEVKKSYDSEALVSGSTIARMKPDKK